VALDVASFERSHQDVQPLGRSELTVDDHDLLISHPARTASYPIAHLAEQRLFADTDTETLRDLSQLLEEYLVSPAHGRRT
jgi:hypothetical protein